jgi:hypothetical protein
MIDTRGDMIAAYTVATVIYLAYIASLWVRGRRLRQIVDDATRDAAADRSHH